MRKKIIISLSETSFVLLFIFFIYGGITIDNLLLYIFCIIICTPIAYILNFIVFRYIAKNWLKWKEVNEDEE